MKELLVFQLKWLNLGGGYVWGNSHITMINKPVLSTTQHMLDPLRGTPYYTVDKILSDWKKQDYNLYMKASSKPLWGKYLLE